MTPRDQKKIVGALLRAPRGVPSIETVQHAFASLFPASQFSITIGDGSIAVVTCIQSVSIITLGTLMTRLNASDVDVATAKEGLIVTLFY